MSAPEEPRTFRLLAHSEAEEQAYDYVKYRKPEKPTGVIESIAHIVKGALGGGILSGHVAFMKAGIFVAAPMNLIFGVYMGYCLYLLVKAAQVLYRRTRVHTMSYPDVGEAAVACHSNPKISRLSKYFRHLIDTMICIDLFGSCAAYQIIIAKSIKQLVENTSVTSIDGADGYPGLRIYLLIMIIPLILICLIRYLKWLAPLSLMANMVILFCVGIAIYYAFENNPKFQGMQPYTSPYSFFQYVGMSVFSMSCVGVVVPIENNMKDPTKFGLVLAVGMGFIILFSFLVSFFGYVGFLDRCESPITVNFPLNIVGKILKGCIIVMIYVTHALNFWVPFNVVFYYLQKRHDPSRKLFWEMVYRALFVTMIGLIAIIFPKITALMGFLGTFCLSNLAFIWPNVIHLLVIWERPGLGRFKWRMWASFLMIAVGIFFLFCGTVVNVIELVAVALHPGKKIED